MSEEEDAGDVILGVVFVTRVSGGVEGGEGV